MTSFNHLTLILSLHYVLKCRNRSLKVYNNKFILDIERVGSEMINEKYNWQLLSLKKSYVSYHIVFITVCAQRVFLQHECKR